MQPTSYQQSGDRSLGRLAGVVIIIFYVATVISFLLRCYLSWSRLGLETANGDGSAGGLGYQGGAVVAATTLKLKPETHNCELSAFYIDIQRIFNDFFGPEPTWIRLWLGDCVRRWLWLWRRLRLRPPSISLNVQNILSLIFPTCFSFLFFSVLFLVLPIAYPVTRQRRNEFQLPAACQDIALPNPLKNEKENEKNLNNIIGIWQADDATACTLTTLNI